MEIDNVIVCNITQRNSHTRTHTHTTIHSTSTFVWQFTVMLSKLLTVAKMLLKINCTLLQICEWEKEIGSKASVIRANSLNGHKTTKFRMQNEKFFYLKFNYVFIRPLSLKILLQHSVVLLWKITQRNDFDWQIIMIFTLVDKK